MASDKALVVCTGMVGCVALGVTYFIVIRQDGTVLLSLTGVLGFLAGLMFPKKKEKEK